MPNKSFSEFLAYKHFLGHLSVQVVEAVSCRPEIPASHINQAKNSYLIFHINIIEGVFFTSQSQSMENRAVESDFRKSNKSRIPKSF